MKKLHMLKFSPGSMSSGDLSAIFVQRERLVEHVMQGIRESVDTLNKHQYLFVGPRGIGKTHLVTLLYYKTLEYKNGHPNVLIARLREEEYVSSFLDLLIRIVNAINELQPEILTQQEIEKVFALQPHQASEYLVDLLDKLLQDRSLVILAENLNQIFDGMAEEGQKRLRAFLQESGKVSIVASTPSLFASVSMHTSPFYGFFEIEHLGELSLQDARELLTKVARHSGNQELARILSTPLGEAKVAAIYHLAGGNHRIYVILSQFLAQEQFNDIVQPFLEMLDDLTPYYQSQIISLSPQQRKIVQFLCECRYAVSVKEIAVRCFITHQTASSQLKSLKDADFVRSIPLGREQRYELREPLMRFSMEMKHSKGEPLRLLVEFLQVWYSTKELDQMLDEIQDPEDDIRAQYLARACEAPKHVKSDVSNLEAQRVHLVREKNFEGALELSKEIAAKRGNEDDYDKLGVVHALLNQTKLALACFEKSLKQSKTYREALLHKGMALLKLDCPTEAASIGEQLIKVSEQDAMGWWILGFARTNTGDLESGLECLKKSLRIDPKNADVSIKLSMTLINLKRFDESLECLDKVLARNSQNLDALILKAYLFASHKQESEAIKLFDLALNLNNKNEFAWVGKGTALVNLHRYDQAYVCFKKASSLRPSSTLPTLWILGCLWCLGQESEFSEKLDALVSRYEFTESSDPLDFSIVLNAVVWQVADEDVLRAFLRQCVDVFAKYDKLVPLSSFLTKTGAAVLSDDIRVERAEQWVYVCESELSNKVHFDITLRLLKAALHSRGAEDIARLEADLPVEERNVFIDMISAQKVYYHFQQKLKDMLSSRRQLPRFK